MSVNAREEEYQEVELFGKPALFTNSRIDPGTIPEGWFCYDLRGNDYDPGRPVTIEPGVVVNHAGTILAPEPVKFRKGQTFRCLRDGLNFVGGNVGLKEFCEDHGITCYDKCQQTLNMVRQEEVIGKVTFASGETLVYTDPAIFLQVIRDELPYKPTSGFQYEVLTDDPFIRKAADDILHSMFGEENLRPLEDYGLTARGRRALRDAENPNLAHKYSWFVVENFCRDGELRHDFESLTGAIDKFNGLNCAEKRLCVTKDDVSTIYLAIAHDGETRLDEGWRDNPRFAADTAINEAAERLQLSIAGLDHPSPTMTMGGLQL